MTIKEALEDTKEASYVGEDGAMVVNCETEEEAFNAFYKLVEETAGKEDADALDREMVGRAHLHLVKEEDKQQFEDCEWYVSLSEKSDYLVWFYMV